MPGKKGFNCVLTLGTDVLGYARNVDPSLEADELDTTTRVDGGWDNWLQGRKRLTADIEALHVPTNAALVALEDAWFNDSNLSFNMIDEDGYGYEGVCGVLSLRPGPRGIDDVVMFNASIKSRGSVSQIPVGS